MGDIFSYLLSSKGAKLSTFKKDPKQVAYEQALGQWQSAVQTLAATLAKSENPQADLQALIQQLPQPTPEQFGYVPGAVKLTPGAATTPNDPTVIEGMSAQLQSFSQAQQQQPGSPQPTPPQA
ncbi:hypothetical protein D3C73_1075070 [compost metagenome]